MCRTVGGDVEGADVAARRGAVDQEAAHAADAAHGGRGVSAAASLGARARAGGEAAACLVDSLAGGARGGGAGGTGA